MKESAFQKDLIDEIHRRLPGCVIVKNDPSYIQGFPDLTIFYGSYYAVLECKKNESATKQPNQSYYIDKLNHMGFARFVYPENKEEILNELESAFKS